MRMSTGKPRPHFCLMRSTTARGKRQRFSRLPPHWSLRSFTLGSRNWLSSQPCPAWMVTMPKPQNLAKAAALPKASMVSSMTSSGMAGTNWPRGFSPSTAP